MMIPKKATVCPYCRKKQGMSLFLAVFLIIIGISVVVGISLNNEVARNPLPVSQEKPSEPNPEPEQLKSQEMATLPDDQKAFIEAIQRAMGVYNAAPNELKKSAVRTSRGNDIKAALGHSRTIHGWVGKLAGMRTNSDGKAIIEIRLEGTNIKIMTWHSALSDLNNNTLITQENPLYSVIAGMDKGQQVLFSGSFIPSDGSDYVKECSLSEAGSMSDPEFVFRFESIEAYRAPRKEDTKATGAFTKSPSHPGYTTYANERFGYQIDYPQEFVLGTPPQSETLESMQFDSPDGKALLTIQAGNTGGDRLIDFYNTLKEGFAGEKILYQVIKDKWFVMTGTYTGKIFYTKAFVGRGSINYFLFTYPAKEKDKYGNVVANIEKSFRPGNIDRAYSSNSPEIQIQALDFINDKAKKKYEGRTIIITGKISGIFIPSPSIQMKMAGEGLSAYPLIYFSDKPVSDVTETLISNGVSCYLDESIATEAIQMQKGQTITLRCKYGGEKTLEACTLVSEAH